MGSGRAGRLTMLTVEIDESVVSSRPARPAAPVRQPPLFTLVLATYGRSDVLGPMLASLASQTWRGFELIVVDQNDDDRVVPMLEPIHQAGIAVSHLRIAAPNLSAARNRGIDAAAGQWVAFPDDDCWYEPDCLARVVEAIGAEPAIDGWVVDWVEASAAAAKAKVGAKVGAGAGATRAASTGAEGGAVRPEGGAGRAAGVPAALDPAVFRAFRGGDASSISLFLRTAVVRAVGSFDVRIGVGRYYGAGEETDLMIRLLDHGAVIRRLSRARVHHYFPTERPALSNAALRGVLRRERGVGALYSKHRLQARVIARGLLVPLVRGVASRRPIRGLLFGFATVLGRIDGMYRWRLTESPPTQADVPAQAGTAAVAPLEGVSVAGTNLTEGSGRSAIAAAPGPSQGERMSNESNRPEQGAR